MCIRDRIISLARHFFCFFFVLRVYVMFCFLVGCQYQRNRLPGKTCLRNDLLCVTSDVKPYTLTQSRGWHIDNVELSLFRHRHRLVPVQVLWLMSTRNASWTTIRLRRSITAIMMLWSLVEQTVSCLRFAAVCVGFICLCNIQSLWSVRWLQNRPVF